MENRYEASPEKSLIGNTAEFENDAKLNREPVKRFQKWDRIGKPRRPCDNPSWAVLNTLKFENIHCHLNWCKGSQRVICWSAQMSTSGFHLLSVPRGQTHAGTAVFFSVAVPSLWNSLHEHVKSSNSMVSSHHHLKTHLFRLAYPSLVSIASDHLLMNFAFYLDYEIAQTAVLAASVSSILFKDVGAMKMLLL